MLGNLDKTKAPKILFNIEIVLKGMSSFHPQKWAYYGLIYSLGLTLTCSLIFGLFHLPRKTISDNMLTYPSYRIVVSTSIILQLCIWCICLYSKRQFNPDAVTWGYFIMIVMLTNWIGLTSILQGTEHVIFVSVFMFCFLTLILIFCTVTWQPEVCTFLRVGLTLMSVCAFAGMVLFNNNEFYLLEHLSFIMYSLIFTFFFTIHPYVDWPILPDNMLPFEEEMAWQQAEKYTALHPLIVAHSNQCTF